MDSIKIKPFLKNIKMHENSLSAIFGVIIIVIFGVTLLNYLNRDKGELTTSAQSIDIGTKTPKTHLVQKGEDLWKISEQTYGDGYKWVEIANANNISNPGIIEVGTELKLPEISTTPIPTEIVKQPTETLAATVTPTPNNIADKIDLSVSVYTVVKGDNLWDICVRAYSDGYKWVEIAKVNNLKNPDLILPGMSLTLPR